MYGTGAAISPVTLVEQNNLNTSPPSPLLRGHSFQIRSFLAGSG
jgi:hypothetical protein